MKSNNLCSAQTFGVLYQMAFPDLCFFSGKKRRLITIHDDVLAAGFHVHTHKTSPGFHEHFDFSGRATEYIGACDN